MTKIKSLSIGLLLVLFSFSAFSQGGTVYDASKKWGIGFNLGGVWQNSDVRDLLGMGFSGYVEHHLVKNEYSAIGFALRGQYFWGYSVGKDWERSTNIINNDALNGVNDPNTDYASSPGFVYHNYLTTKSDFSLNAMLTLNRLRARTGILLYGWGGIGVTGFTAKMNQLGTFGGQYNYGSITAANKNDVLDDLDFMRDNDYETYAEGTGNGTKWVLAPNAGLGFGYEFTPTFSMALEYKVTFPFTDLLDGNRWRADNTLGKRNDRYNYWGLAFNFFLGGGGYGGYQDDNTTYTPSPTPQPTGYPPVITLIDPYNSPATTANCGINDIRMSVTNVNSKEEITVIQNGVTVSAFSYSYYANTDELVIKTPIGNRSEFTVTARNSYGSDRETLVITCGQETPPPPPPPAPTGNKPVVEITNPSTNPYVTQVCHATIEARVLNVTGKSQIKVYKDGQEVPSFTYTYNMTSKTLLFNQKFDGLANYHITAQNSYGSATDNVSFRCSPPVNPPPPPPPSVRPPIVNMLFPIYSPYTSASCNETIRAEVFNVSSKYDITVTMNGITVPSTDYAYSSGSGVLTLNRSFNNDTYITITARNAAGTASASTRLVCKEQEAPPTPRPTVQIISPTGNPYISATCDEEVKARIKNVTKKQDIRVTRNGSIVPAPEYYFDNRSGYLTLSTSIGDQDLFVITATNESGSASGSITIKCKKVEKRITICHYPPGNQGNPRTLNVPESALQAHLNHGDKMGACPVINPPTVKITTPSQNPYTCGNCQTEVVATTTNIDHKSQVTVTVDGIATSNFSFSNGEIRIYQTIKKQNVVKITVTNSSGTDSDNVTLICKEQEPPKEDITICHYPPGNRDNPQTLTIPESAWPAHQAHGDTKGACPVLNPPTVNITTPSQNPYETRDCQVTVKATVNNVKEKGNISVSANGNTISNFTFNGNQVSFSYNINDIDVIVVLASNGAGSASDQTTLKCIKEEPKITICHYPPGNKDNPQTLTIPESAWPAHQAHGDTKGACPVLQKPVINIQQPGNHQTTVESCKADVDARVYHVEEKSSITVTQDGRSIGFSFSKPSLSFTANIDERSTFVITATNGAGSAIQTINYVCIKEDPKITICHYPPGNKDNPQTITISESAWPAHQAHGDTKGTCPVIEHEPEPDKKITICHYPPGNKDNPQTITISESAWPAHQAHGDTKGTCPVIETEPEPDKKITICHYPPGNKDNPQTLTISENAWPAHQAHGDTKGACPTLPRPSVSVSATAGNATTSNCVIHVSGSVSNVTEKSSISITVNGRPHNNFSFSNGKVSFDYTSTGGSVSVYIEATNASGKASGSASATCKLKEPEPEPEKKITICHYPPGNKNNPQTITISENAWPAHQAHGDTKGACPAPKPEPEKPKPAPPKPKPEKPTPQKPKPQPNNRDKDKKDNKKEEGKGDEKRERRLGR